MTPVRTWAAVAVACVVAVVAAGRAHADPPGAVPGLEGVASTGAARPITSPIELFATQPLALLGRGLVGSYERELRPRWSVGASLGVRGGAGGDFTSRTVTLGAEARWWPLRRIRWLFVGVHASAGHTAVHDDVMDVDIGTAWQTTERLDVGWRFIAGRHVAISPTLGLALHQDLDGTGRLATTTRAALAIGCEVGWRR